MRLFSCLFLVIFCAGSFELYSQSRSSLAQKKAVLQKEIRRVNRLLSDGTKKEKHALDERKRLDKIIALRSKFILEAERHIHSLDNKIDSIEEKKEEHSQSLKKMRQEYSENIANIYKNSLVNNPVLFLLAAKSVRQAIVRQKYLEQLANYRKNQINQIIQKEDTLRRLEETIRLEKDLKQREIIPLEQERKQLTIDRQQQYRLAKKIHANNSKYRIEIRQKQREELKIDREIALIIKGNNRLKLTPKLKKLSGDFERNKGKLPWPVMTALVVRRFGKGIPHETVKGIRITSNGVHIATDKNSTVSSVFKGRVIAVSVSNNGVKNVLVQHGAYVSVYANLHPVYVAKGDDIDVQQKIGMVHTNAVTKKTILKFQIWKQTKPQNPQKWLLKM